MRVGMKSSHLVSPNSQLITAETLFERIGGANRGAETSRRQGVFAQGAELQCKQR